MAALFYSLIESAKLCGVEPHAYLREATLRAGTRPRSPWRATSSPRNPERKAVVDRLGARRKNGQGLTLKEQSPAYVKYEQETERLIAVVALRNT